MQSYETEKVYNILEKYLDKKIFIYGLSEKTKQVIDILGKEKVNAVVSNTRIGETLYGLDIVSVDTLTKDDILILATYNGSLKVVYERIKHIENNGVKIFDLSLTNLTDEKSKSIDFDYLNAKVETEADKQVLNLIFNRLNSKLDSDNASNEIFISSLENMGYVVFGAITVAFIEHLSNLNDENSIILFGARDGYLINQLYEKYKIKKPQLPNNEYVYLSRRSLLVPNIHNVDDIIKLVENELRFTVGNLRERFKRSIGIDLGEEFDIELSSAINKEEVLQNVLKYKNEILENADNERVNYIKYLKSIGLDNYDKVYIFDLYTQGTIPVNLSKFINDLSTVCFAYKENEKFENKEIFSMFSPINIFYFNNFFKVYQFLELVYSPSDGQLKYIDEQGNKVFVENTKYNYKKIEKIQKGIFEFFDDYFSLRLESSISRNLADTLLESLNNNNIDRSVVGDTFLSDAVFEKNPKKNLWEELIIQ